jgi:hypothetical protein
MVLPWPELAAAEFGHTCTQVGQKVCDQYTPESDSHHSFLFWFYQDG